MEAIGAEDAPQRRRKRILQVARHLIQPKQEADGAKRDHRGQGEVGHLVGDDNGEYGEVDDTDERIELPTTRHRRL